MTEKDSVAGSSRWAPARRRFETWCLALPACAHAGYGLTIWNDPGQSSAVAADSVFGPGTQPTPKPCWVKYQTTSGPSSAPLPPGCWLPAEHVFLTETRPGSGMNLAGFTNLLARYRPGQPSRSACSVKLMLQPLPGSGPTVVGPNIFALVLPLGRQQPFVARASW